MEQRLLLPLLTVNPQEKEEEKGKETTLFPWRALGSVSLWVAGGGDLGRMGVIMYFPHNPLLSRCQPLSRRN